MDRKFSYELLLKYVRNKNLIKHSLAVEAIMKQIARDLNERNFSIDGKAKKYNEEKWAITGLLHDIDYEETADDPLRHSLIGAQILEKEGFEDEIIYAVKAHNDAHGLPLKSEMDIALFSCDPVSGLIVASALIKPEKKLDAIDAEFIFNRYKEKSFAKGANRKTMMVSENLNYELLRFFETSLTGMKEISSELGL